MNSDVSMSTPVPSQTPQQQHTSTQSKFGRNNTRTQPKPSSNNNTVKKYNKQSSVQRDFSRATKWI